MDLAAFLLHGYMRMTPRSTIGGGTAKTMRRLLLALTFMVLRW
jgi:hypothetical protein